MSNMKAGDVIIDGAIPRIPPERCQRLLDYAHDEVLNQAQINHAFERWTEFYTEITVNWSDEEFEWWSLEDDIIDFINEMLPVDCICLIHPDDPGTVVIWERNDLDDYDSA
jgi:hypothetical protein